jgi:hypothetical protein
MGCAARRVRRWLFVVVADTEAKLRIALIATYGPLDGQTAALDALSWA